MAHIQSSFNKLSQFRATISPGSNARVSTVSPSPSKFPDNPQILLRLHTICNLLFITAFDGMNIRVLTSFNSLWINNTAPIAYKIRHCGRNVNLLSKKKPTPQASHLSKWLKGKIAFMVPFPYTKNSYYKGRGWKVGLQSVASQVSRRGLVGKHFSGGAYVEKCHTYRNHSSTPCHGSRVPKNYSSSPHIYWKRLCILIVVYVLSMYS